MDLLRAPWILLLVAAAAVWYWRGSRRPKLRVVAGAKPRRGVPWRGLSFAAGLATLVVALDSPLDRLANDWFWAHMLQHVLLMMVVPPLLLLGALWIPFWRPLPIGLRRRLTPAHAGRTAALVASPLAAWLLFDVNLALWHVPALYDLTLRNTAVHDLEHLSFIVLGILFWSHVIDAPPFRSRLSSFGRVIYATAGSAASWLLAVVLALATTPLYPAQTAGHGGISAIADQQLAAGVMIGPGSVPYAIVVFYWLYVWLGVEESDGLRPRARHAATGTGAR